MQVGDKGLEPTPETLEICHSAGERSIFVATQRTDAPSDADLANWLEACPVALDDTAKASILAMVASFDQAAP